MSETKQKSFEERFFDTGTLKGLAQAEKYKARLNNKYVRVTVIPAGLNRVRIMGDDTERVPDGFGGVQ